MLDLLKQLTKEKRDADSTAAKESREEKIRQQVEEDRLAYEKGKRDAVKYVELLQGKLLTLAQSGKDCGRFRAPSDFLKSPHGRGFHEVADPLIKALGIQFAWFDVWHTLYDPENGKEDGGYRDYGIGVWWGSCLPDMKREFYFGGGEEVC